VRSEEGALTFQFTMGRGCWERRKLPSEVWDKAPATNGFFGSMKQILGHKKMRIVGDSYRL